jgi:hypothetical protein
MVVDAEIEEHARAQAVPLPDVVGDPVLVDRHEQLVPPLTGARGLQPEIGIWLE